MPKRNEKAILQDILFNLDAILKFTRNITFDDFVADIKTQYAVDRCFEIVGEATRQLPGEFITKHPEVEWQKMIAFRNLLIHEYFRVERRIQWNIIVNVIPMLKAKVETLYSNNIPMV